MFVHARLCPGFCLVAFIQAFNALSYCFRSRYFAEINLDMYVSTLSPRNEDEMISIVRERRECDFTHRYA